MSTLKDVVAICKKYHKRDPKKERNLFLGSLLWVLVAWGIQLLSTSILLSFAVSMCTVPAFIRLFHYHHEHMHGAFIDKGSVYGKLLRFSNRVLMMTDGKLWERGHNKHHKEVGQFGVLLAGAVGLVTAEHYRNLSRKNKALYHAFRNPVILIVLSYFSIFLFYFNLFPIITGSKSAKRGWIAMGYHFGAMLVLGLLFGPMAPVWMIFVPMVFGASVGTALFYMQHLYEGAKYGESEDPLLTRVNNTSSRFVASKLTLFLIGGQENHHIHHIDPKMPFYMHREAYLAEPELQKCSDVRLNLSTLYKGMHCFVWHEDKFLNRKEARAYGVMEKGKQYG